MKKIFTWLYILTKRQLKNTFFIVLLFFIPLSVFLTNILPSGDDNGNYYAGIYVNGKITDEFAEVFIKNLLSNQDSFRFVFFDDEEKMKQEIIREKLVCGYVIPADIRDIISSGNSKKCIDVYKIPASTIQPAVNEVVYAELIKIQGYRIMDEYMKNSDIFPDGDYMDEASKYYELYTAGKDTIKINYEELGSDEVISAKDIPTRLSFPVRGILSILVFLSGLFGGVIFLRDTENGIFQTIEKGFKSCLRILYIFIPAFILGICAVITMLFSKDAVAFSKEFVNMLMLIVMTVIFTLLLTLITKKSKTLSACIPVIMICSLVFCPIFINIDIYIPFTKYIQKLFVPYYYLKLF